MRIRKRGGGGRGESKEGGEETRGLAADLRVPVPRALSESMVCKGNSIGGGEKRGREGDFGRA